MLTRREIEERLERKYLNKVVSFLTIHDKEVCGKMHRVAVDVRTGEPMVVFQLDNYRYEADVDYFLNHTTIHNGDTQRTSGGSPGV